MLDQIDRYKLANPYDKEVEDEDPFRDYAGDVDEAEDLHDEEGDDY